MSSFGDDYYDGQPYYSGRRSNTWHRGGRGGGQFDGGSYSDRSYRGGYKEGGRSGGFRGGGYSYRGGGWQGGNNQYYYDDAYSSRGGGGRRGRGGRRGGQVFGRGRSYSGQTRQREEEPAVREEEQALPADVRQLTELQGHSKKITAITFEPTSRQVYTASFDGTVRLWSTDSGQVVSSLEVGGEVDSMLLAGGFLFVGFHKGTEGIIKVWNMATGSDHILTGHKAIITKEDGGHSSQIIAITVLGPFMFTTDFAGTILVWDLNTGKVTQSLVNAHEGPIMQLLVYESHMLSAGIDGLIKVWEVLSSPAPGMVLKPEPDFVFDKDKSEDGPRRAKSQRPGILAMAPTSDPAGNPILMVSYNGEKCVRLFELPTFSSRGCLLPVEMARTLASVSIDVAAGEKNTVMMTGDRDGAVRIFAWQGQPTR
ncbi:WD40-repeat-containing domain protein [Dunaliella salina]|uniref:WD40-repeat-containing domain protein n=1 Tax=Dunaliella salina TaxID=3046 RepID=A0ABQ7G4U8_DUNSA|nr:WD40-repeat-containing domain protein [Dunaliella salina]|eukprot:KAF5829633.1 WD40-repeat-containing domain protein [Dunaliella salina]